MTTWDNALLSCVHKSSWPRVSWSTHTRRGSLAAAAAAGLQCESVASVWSGVKAWGDKREGVTPALPWVIKHLPVRPAASESEGHRGREWHQMLVGALWKTRLLLCSVLRKWLTDCYSARLNWHRRWHHREHRREAKIIRPPAPHVSHVSVSVYHVISAVMLTGLCRACSAELSLN